MKSLEFYQYCGSLSNRAMMLGTTHSSSKGRIKPVVSSYMQEVTKVLEFINSKKDKNDSFGPKELNELVTGITNLRVALKKAKGTISKNDYEKNSELITTIEQVVALMDVTSGKSLNEVIDNTEVTSVSTNVNPSKVGGNSSSRSLISVKFGNNNKVDGYFTPEHKIFDENLANEVDFMFKKAIADNPNELSIKYFYNRLKLTPYGMHTLFQCMNREFKPGPDSIPTFGECYIKKNLKHYGLLGNFETLENFEKDKSKLTKVLMEIRRSFEGRFGELYADCYQYTDWEEVGVKAVAGSSKPARNVAFSNVANILGVPKLVAKSVPITVKVNGKNQQGVFMKQAEGLDAPDTPKLYKTDFMLCDSHSFDGEALKQIADLQVLDFICMNVDRHASNLLYTIDKDGKLTGVQGIDNDLSFGTLKFKNSLTTNFGNALNDITVISESMAHRIRTIQQETFVASISGLGLKKEEIQSAWDRLLTVRKQLEKKITTGAPTPGKIKVVPDKDWSTLELKPLAKARQYEKSKNESLRKGIKNLFTRVWDLLDEIGVVKYEHYKGKSAAYIAYKKMGFGDLINEENNAEVRAKFAATEEFRAASFSGIEDIRADLSASENVMKNAGEELANDATFIAMVRELELANGEDYALLKNETGSLDETHLGREKRMFDQQKLRDTFRGHLLNVIYTTKEFLEKFSNRASEPGVREQYENAMKLYKNTVQSEEVFQNANNRRHEEELNMVQLELQDEQRRFNDIVQTIVDQLANKLEGMEGLEPEEIMNSLYDGPALKTMMDDADLLRTLGESDYIKTYSTMAYSHPEDLLDAYCQHVFSAHPNNVANDRISQAILNNPEKFRIVKEVIGKDGLLVVEDEIKNDETLIGSTKAYNRVVNKLNVHLGSAAMKCRKYSYSGEEGDIDRLAAYINYRSLKDKIEELGKQTLDDEAVEQLKAFESIIDDRKSITQIANKERIDECVHDECRENQLTDDDLNMIYNAYDELPKVDVKLEKKEVLLCKDDPKFQNLMKEIRDNINQKVDEIESERSKNKAIDKKMVANVIVQYEKLEALEKLADRKCTNSLYEKAAQIVDDSNIQEKVDQRVKEIVNNPAFRSAQTRGTNNTRHFDHDVMNAIRKMFDEGSKPAAEQDAPVEGPKA